MSFILDALRKSEKRRPAGAVPDLETDHLGPAPGRPSRLPLVILLVAVVLVNGGLLLWWQPWQPARQDVPVAAESAPSPLAQDISAAAPSPPLAPPIAPAEPPMPPAPAPIAPPPANPLGNVGQTLIVPDPPAEAQESAPALAAVPRENDPFVPPPAPAQTSSPASAPLVLPLEDLPPSIRGGLPEFNFSLHYFTADPAQRMVRINGRILREGQELASGVLLDEITPGGAIFSYRGMRFEVVRF